MRSTASTARHLFFLMAAFVYLNGDASLAGSVPICEEVCGETAECSDVCYENMMEFENGNDITCGTFDGGWPSGWCEVPPTCENLCSPWVEGSTECEDNSQWTTCESYGVYLRCGDEFCAVFAETPSNCSDDCGYCGDGFCNTFSDWESTMSCPEDCGGNGGGSGPTCGNSECDSGETCESCPQDCASQCGGCGDSFCSAAEFGGAGSGYVPGCNLNTDFWCSYCPQDCGGCSAAHCYPQLCDDVKPWQCKGCTNGFQCPTGEYCDLDGGCRAGWDSCWHDSQCRAPLGSHPDNWVCKNFVCAPSWAR